MTLTNDMFIAGAIGAGLALFAVRQFGLLKLPRLDGSAKSPLPATPPQVVHIFQKDTDQQAGPAYEATINVPHKITVTPQVNK